MTIGSQVAEVGGVHEVGVGAEVGGVHEVGMGAGTELGGVHEVGVGAEVGGVHKVGVGAGAEVGGVHEVGVGAGSEVGDHKKFNHNEIYCSPAEKPPTTNVNWDLTDKATLFCVRWGRRNRNWRRNDEGA